ncbi:sensor histidine kinase [Streptomyces sp. NPDC048606]|uniref:sensor histidine kinase n=1 Tax=Streptomyces sp. NPDC048606 TaxID=3154726 RepID=UPI00342ECF69
MSASVSLPLLKRIPPGLWTALAWCATSVQPIVEYVVMPPGPTHSLNFPRDGLDSLASRLLLVLAFVLVLAGSALLRRAGPSAYALVIAGVVASTVAWRQDEIPPLQFLTVDVALCHMAAVRPRRDSLTAGAGALAVLTCYFVLRLVTGEDSGVAPEPFLALTVVIAWLIGNSVHQARAHTEELYARAAEQAVIAERLRIAREMHDTVAHSIGIIALQAGAAARVVETQPDRAREAMVAVEKAGRETLSGLRRMLGALRQADEDRAEVDRADRDREHDRDPASGSAGRTSESLRPAAGLADVERLAETATAAGVRVEVRREGVQRPLPADVDLAALRIVQESVTNAVRHSGADSCLVQIAYGADELTVEVSDRGSGGPDVGHAGFGLIGMRERAALLHGDFTAGPRPGGGFRVAVRLPIPATTETEEKGRAR